jgi:DNA-binding NtrC family response regulator
MSHVLIVDDEVMVRDALRAYMIAAGHSSTCASSGTEALQCLAANDIDVVLTDVMMPDVSGLDLCRYVAEHRPDVPVVMVTGHGDMDVAVSALRVGAYDFIVKPLTVPTLRAALDRALQHRGVLRRLTTMRSEKPGAADEIIGESSEMRAVTSLIGRVAGSDASVLITGASGTGKDVVARAIHTRSGRASRPFVSINCAALPEALLESELFGHVRGAFTDAKENRDGLFVTASGGTLFLDEIGDLPLALQPKLLRALQERKVRPVGAKHELDIDVRLITATNHDLEAAVEEKTFRSDLYYRINVVNLKLPTLHARGSDVLLLADHFLKRFAAQEGKSITGLSSAVAKQLLEYHWPGNVRELQNSMHRAVALARGEEIMPVDLPEHINAASSEVALAPGYPSELLPLRDVERRYVARVLTAVSGNKSNAARILGIDRKTLYRKIES